MAPALERGLKLSGNLLSEELGAGGFARVFRAEPEGGGAPVAIKVAIRPELVTALREEGAALRRLRGPRFVKVLAENLDADPPHIVLELCPGGDLRARLERSPGKRLPPKEVDRLFLEILDGVIEAHAERIVHGDLKPENVLLDERGSPRLADFGLSRVLRRELVGQGKSLEDSLATVAGKVRGTLDYLAPELRKGADSSPRTDIYALGVMLYEMLVGERPFGLFKLPSVAAGAPAYFDRVVSRALASNPEDRYGTAREMLDDLEAGEKPARVPSPEPWPLSKTVVAWACLGMIAGVGGGCALREPWLGVAGIFAGSALGGWLGGIVYVIRVGIRRALRG
jgi:serine/threonine-protein kinase